MCGIVGYVGAENCSPILVDGLRRLEYRGYDSAGLAVQTGRGIQTIRAAGKLRELEAALRARPLEGVAGIGHTRWATHGAPSERNAHPHVVGKVAIVHNGIIENHLELRRRLVETGAQFASDTDTELVAHLVATEVDRGQDLEEAVARALSQVHGAYAIAALSESEPERIVVAKNSAPLVVGVSEGATYCASDIPALLPYTTDMVFLEDREMAILERGGLRLRTLEGARVEREPRRIDWSPVMAEKAGYKHFMLKEIFEQPRAIEDTLRGRLNREEADIRGEEIGLDAEQARRFERIVLLACGTSHHATIAGRYWLEDLARIPTVVELASEFRGRPAIVGKGDLVVVVSQSGETLDTLMAAQKAKAAGATTLGIVNVIGSAIARTADAAFYTHAGPEIGVASTKCFTTQLAALLMLGIWLGKRRGTLDDDRASALIEEMARLPQHMTDVLHGTRQLMASIARRFAEARDVLFLGRGLSYPIALEGALKLKEISYVHAEGYAAGEMKHGPIALLDAHVPVIVLTPRDAHYERAIGNLQEAKARDAKVIAIASVGDHEVARIATETVEVPLVGDDLTPFVTVLPLQLYAYYVADFMGTDVDQPRNLAKTVTVE